MRVLTNYNYPKLGFLDFCQLGKQENSEFVKHISNLLISCATKLAESENGHVPDDIVQNRILKYYTTIESILKLNSGIASRFFLLFENNVIATALVANKPGILMPEETHGAHDWSNFIKHSDLNNYHSIFNVAVSHDFRRIGLAKFLIDRISDLGNTVFPGKGLFTRSEPPDHDIWNRIGFVHKPNFDDFFTEKVPLPIGVKSINQYNSQFFCSCPKNNQWDKNFLSYKIKCFGLTKEFSHP